MYTRLKTHLEGIIKFSLNVYVSGRSKSGPIEFKDGGQSEKQM